ncbi:MAG: AlpA family transcriptional regulator, partial [Planctomycetota bacterium]|nr:AlpA family transcriptional regulator [Planctomycetota bacterium]
MDNSTISHSTLDCGDAISMPALCAENDGEKKCAEIAVYNIGKFHDDDCLTREGMRAVFQCSERTLFRMVERFEIPPPMPLGGRSVWQIGRLKAWIVSIAQHKEAEALKEAKR